MTPGLIRGRVVAERISWIRRMLVSIWFISTTKFPMRSFIVYARKA